MKRLMDRVAVVTGAAGGIGRAIALDLARAGMHLVLADRDEPGISRVASEIRGLGRHCSVVCTDVRSLEQIEQLLAHALADYGSCHLLINNAGILHAAPLLDASLGDWKRVIDVNLWGVLYGSRVFGRHFAQQGEGHIVNVASAGGIFPSPGMTMYSTSKFAVVGFTQQLRWELAPDGVGVTLVIPGLVKSPFLDRPEVGLDHLNTALVMRASSSPEGLARKLRRGVQSNKALVRYGHDALLMSLLRFLPTSLLDLLGKRFARIVLGLLRGKSGTSASPDARGSLER